MKKENTHIVIKREDALKYLTEVEYQTLEEFMNTIIRGRAKDQKKPINNYYICNTDEPYAEVVHGVIIGGEATKSNNSNPTYCPGTCGNGCLAIEAREVAIKSLEKQIPKKPRFYAHNYYCIECGNLVGNNEFEWQRFLYCDKCGQKIDWQ